MSAAGIVKVALLYAQEHDWPFGGYIGLWRGRRYVVFGPAEWLVVSPGHGLRKYASFLIDEQTKRVIKARLGRGHLCPGWFLVRHELNPLHWVRRLVCGQEADQSYERWYRRLGRRKA
jgi:hypothetical protein